MNFILILTINLVSSISLASISYVGVISYSNVFSKSGVKPEVIPIFIYQSKNWKEISKNQTINGPWRVILDGKKIGEIKVNAEVSLNQFSPVEINFTNFLGEVNHKAFALVSNENFKDPSQWKPWTPEKIEKKKLQENYLKLISRNSDNEKKHFRCPGFWKLSEKQKVESQENCSEKVILKKAYQDKFGNQIAQFVIETNKPGDFEGTTEIINKWVKLKRSGKMQLLLDNHEEIWDAYLIEAADFEGSGKSQLLFETSGYNSFGYQLFDSQLHLIKSYSGSYH